MSNHSDIAIPPPVPGMDAIYGRDEELAALRSIVTGQTGGLRILGRAGAGKTTLWLAAIEAARHAGATVLVSRPAESEARLSFSGLRDLLDSRFDSIADRLPPPQRQALGVALLRFEPGERPERAGAVEAAFLHSLQVLADDNPVLAAIDDEQWLDRNSRRAVEYAARRLGTTRVSLLTTARTASGAIELPAAQTIDLQPLSLGALHAMLRDRLGQAFPRPVLRRIRATSQGNPFVALEIGRLLLERSAPLRATDELPLPADDLQLVEHRLQRLPAPIRTALTIAAALSDPTVDLVAAAGGGDLRGAEQAGIVVIESGRVRFSHPLFASGVYRAAGTAELRRIHRRLAALGLSLEERARHRALAANGPDEHVAVALEQAAQATFSRGAVDAAVELITRACELTPPGRRTDLHRRRIAQAEYSLKSGDLGRTREVADAAIADAEPGTGRAEALFYRGRAEMFGAGWQLAELLFTQAASEAAVSTEVQARIQLAFAQLRTMSGRAPRDGLERARAAARLAELCGRDDILCEALSIEAKQRAMLGDGDPNLLLERAMTLQPAMSALWVSQWPLDIVAAIREWQDDLVEAATIFEEVCRLAAERGDEASREWTLWRLAHVELLAGAWAAAEAHIDEGRALAVQAGRRDNEAVYLGMLGLLAAHRGDAPAAAANAALASPGEASGDLATPSLLARRARGLLELSLGRVAEAELQLGPLVDVMRERGIVEPGAARFVPDEIEALIGLGELDRAEALLADLEARAHRLDRPSALAAAARCRGLLLAELGSADAAIEALRGALLEHERVAMPFERARTLLALGRVARRAKARRLSRESLTEAERVFAELGASIWRGRARDELARVPGRARSEDRLTPTEERVAELLAGGASVADVAAAMFVTPKTVETYAQRIYAKLDIHSRASLAAWMAGHSLAGAAVDAALPSTIEVPSKL